MPTFISTCRDVLPLVMSEAPLRRIESADTTWESCHRDLEALVAESAIGGKLFARAVNAWKTERVHKCIEELLARAPETMDLGTVKSMFEQLEEETKTMDTVHLHSSRASNT